MSSVGESILMALTVTVNKMNSSNVRAVRRNEAPKTKTTATPNRRSGLILMSSAVVVAATAPQPQLNDDSSSSSQLLRKYLKKSEENKAKNDKERLDSYYKRNYRDYFEFVEGGLAGKEEEELSESEKGILDWLKSNKKMDDQDETEVVVYKKRHEFYSLPWNLNCQSSLSAEFPDFGCATDCNKRTWGSRGVAKGRSEEERGPAPFSQFTKTASGTFGPRFTGRSTEDSGVPAISHKISTSFSQHSFETLSLGFLAGLLRKGYNYDRMLSISTKRFSVLNITTTIHDGRLASVGFGTKLNSGNAALDLNNSFTSAALSYNGKLLPSANVSALLNFPDYKNSKVSTTLMYRGKHLLPAEFSASLKLPDDGTNKVKVQCLHRYTTCTMSVAFKQPPVVKLSSTFGTPKMAMGVEATYHTLPFCFTDWQAGFTISNCRSIAALIMADKGDHYSVSCLHYFDRSMKTAASAEIATKLSDKTHTFAVGGSCMIDHLKLKMKGKVDNQGKIEALIQHKIKHKFSLTICCEYDIRTPYKMPIIGIVAGLIL